MHLWHIGALPSIFNSLFKYAGDVHSYNTRYASDRNLYKSKVRTNIGKQSISFMAIDIWNSIPVELNLAKKHTLFPKTLNSTYLKNKLLNVKSRCILAKIYIYALQFWYSLNYTTIVTYTMFYRCFLLQMLIIIIFYLILLIFSLFKPEI